MVSPCLPSRPRPQYTLPFLHDKLRPCILARLTGARETRRAAKLSSSGITATKDMLKQDARLKVKVQAHVSSTQGYHTKHKQLKTEPKKVARIRV